jgi:hypothetical protein
MRKRLRQFVQKLRPLAFLSWSSTVEHRGQVHRMAVFLIRSPNEWKEKSLNKHSIFVFLRWNGGFSSFPRVKNAQGRQLMHIMVMLAAVQRYWENNFLAGLFEPTGLRHRFFRLTAVEWRLGAGCRNVLHPERSPCLLPFSGMAVPQQTFLPTPVFWRTKGIGIISDR